MAWRLVCLTTVCLGWTIFGWTGATHADPAPPEKPPTLFDESTFVDEVADESTFVDLEHTTEHERPTLLVDNFDEGPASGLYVHRTTSMGGYHGTFVKRPSYALIAKSREHRFGEIGRSLSLEWVRQRGWCGYYTLLRDRQGQPADVSRFNALCFQIKGEIGDETFDIGFTDQRMQDLQISARYVGDVNRFLPKSVSRQWQQVKVPLSMIRHAVDVQRMGALVFFFRQLGKGKVYIDNIEFRNDPEVSRWEQENIAKAEPVEGYPRGLWVWKVDPAAHDAAKEQLLAFCQRVAAKRIYQYIDPFNAEHDSAYIAGLNAYLEACHQRGIRVEAMTGHATGALAEYHHETLRWLHAILDYNRSRPPESRFDGAVLDIEPYLLPQWETDKARIKQQFLEILQKCRRAIEHDDPTFTLRIAAPLVYEQEESADGFVSEIFKWVDHIALMDYYDSPNKLISHAQPFVDLATEQGKKIWITIETQDLAAMKIGPTYNTFWDEGWVDMEAALGSVHDHFKDASGYGGLDVHCYYAYKAMPRLPHQPTQNRPIPEDSDTATIPCLSAKRPVNIDGSLDEWRGIKPIVLNKRDHVAYNPSAWGGWRDLSSRCYTVHNASHLYFAFDITDDLILQSQSGTDMWKGDHVELWLDVDLMGDYRVSVNNLDDFQFGFSPGNFKDLPAEAVVFTPDVIDRDSHPIQIASSRTKNGYTLEVAIPKAYLLDQITQLTKRQSDAQGHMGVDPRLDQPTQAADASPITPHPDAPLLDLGPGVRLGIGYEPSDCDDPSTPQKCLMSTSDPRRWGDPTTFVFLELE